MIKVNSWYQAPNGNLMLVVKTNTSLTTGYFYNHRFGRLTKNEEAYTSSVEENWALVNNHVVLKKLFEKRRW